MSMFYDKLDQLPAQERKDWEAYLLHWYSLQDAARLLEFVIEADRWIPKMLDVAERTCKRLKVAQVTDVVAAFQAKGMMVDTPFTQAILQRNGETRRLAYHSHGILEASCVSRADDHVVWISTIHQLLERSVLLRRADVIECLHLEHLLRHWNCLRIFDVVVSEGGIGSLTPRLPAGEDASIIADQTETDSIEWTGRMAIERTFTVYADPSVVLTGAVDAFYFNQRYLDRWFAAVAEWMRERGVKEITDADARSVVIERWRLTDAPPRNGPVKLRLARGRCRPDLLDGLFEPFTAVSGWLHGAVEIDGRLAQQRAGLERIAGGFRRRALDEDVRSR